MGRRPARAAGACMASDLYPRSDGDARRDLALDRDAIRDRANLDGRKLSLRVYGAGLFVGARPNPADRRANDASVAADRIPDGALSVAHPQVQSRNYSFRLPAVLDELCGAR